MLTRPKKPFRGFNEPVEKLHATINRLQARRQADEWLRAWFIKAGCGKSQTILQASVDSITEHLTQLVSTLLNSQVLHECALVSRAQAQEVLNSTCEQPKIL